jgi:hypothetical protein
MAPEQIGDHAIDHRADLYAVGAVLFELISGVPPLDADDLVEQLRRVIVTRPPLLSSRVTLPVAVRDGMDRLLARCLEKRPCDRPGSARELIEYMDEIAARLIAPAALVRDVQPPMDAAFSRDEPRRGFGTRLVVGALALTALFVGARIAVDDAAPPPVAAQVSPAPEPASGVIEGALGAAAEAPAIEALVIEAPVAKEPLDQEPLDQEPLDQEPLDQEPVLAGVSIPSALDRADERRERRRARRRARAEAAETQPILTLTAVPEPADAPRTEPLDRDGVLNPFR